jgi:hypothetical protein
MATIRVYAVHGINPNRCHTPIRDDPQRQRKNRRGEIESNNCVVNTTTLYGDTFEQRDTISVREQKVVNEKSTT